jgi:hypothetical protein
MTIERPATTFSNDEVGMLRAFLDHYRATIRLQASGLTDAQLDQALAPSDLTLGGMLKHLAFVEDYWFSYNLMAHEPAPPWDAWRVAGYYGLDRYLLPALGAPWRPGAVFRRGASTTSTS